ncbi:hypothetical protein IH979_00525 [Patescibacteria group bacterium]|nr:hypothetical protein [Patescibacteria group bacterium]
MLGLLLSGIVLFTVPLVLFCGFALVIFVQFLRNDDDAIAVFRVAMIIMFFGAALIGAHFILKATTG